MSPEAQKLLQIEDLVLHFKTNNGTVQAVDSVDFDLDTNRAVVILGESGCGKSSLAKAILRLLPRNVESYGGSVYLQGTDVMKFDEEQFRQALEEFLLGNLSGRHRQHPELSEDLRGASRFLRPAPRWRYGQGLCGQSRDRRTV